MTNTQKHATRLTSDQIRDYLSRSYTAVDGLWFMKTEGLFGFEKALEIDALVWQVMPKIQARQLKSMLTAERSLDGLRTCYAEKLFLDGFEFQILSSASPEDGPGTGETENVKHTPSASKVEHGMQEAENRGMEKAPGADKAGKKKETKEKAGEKSEFSVRIFFCPWVDKLVRSSRGHLAAAIGRRICAAEYAGWAAEFGCRFEFGGDRKLCEEGDACVLRFREA